MWALALALAVVLAWALERKTRAGGQRPSVVDDAFLWSLTRREVDDDPRTVVFLGASRMALGYSPAAFAEAAPGWRGLQLSISDYLPLGVLEDLAGDEAFRGVVVLDLIESDIADALLLPDARAHVATARELWRAPGALANRYLASHAQAQLALLAIGGRRVVSSLVGRRRWPAPNWVAVDRARSSYADYQLGDAASLHAKAARRLAGFPPGISPQAWQAIVDRDVEPLIQRVQARGGKVLVIRPPVSGGLAAKLDELYPRAQYWDAWAARSQAVVLHYRDLPAMANLTCPDEMHLDQRDQATFTRALVDALRQHGLLMASPEPAHRTPDSVKFH